MNEYAKMFPEKNIPIKQIPILRERRHYQHFYSKEREVQKIFDQTGKFISLTEQE